VGFPDPVVIAPPHLQDWAKSLEAELRGKARPGTIVFSSSGSSGGPPKGILHTRESLECDARGVLDHLGAWVGDWSCPLPAWHIGGAMVYIRAALAGTQVHTFRGDDRGKWNPRAFADFLRSHPSAWTSLVPTQVVDIVHANVVAPPGLRCIIVGGGTLDQSLGQQARDLGWPVVQSYGMTETGSQIATGNPSEPYSTTALPILPHWKLTTTPSHHLALQGPGLFYAQVHQSPSTWIWDMTPTDSPWSNNDIVEVADGKLTFIRRSDRVIKILGELVDMDQVEHALQALCPGAVVDSIPQLRQGAALVACHPNADQLAHAVADWNSKHPGFMRIAHSLALEIPRNPMGKLNRKALQDLIRQAL
jgi:O-succinylbenzoic acid--CoA ligase